MATLKWRWNGVWAPGENGPKLRIHLTQTTTNPFPTFSSLTFKEHVCEFPVLWIFACNIVSCKYFSSNLCRGEMWILLFYDNEDESWCFCQTRLILWIFPHSDKDDGNGCFSPIFQVSAPNVPFIVGFLLHIPWFKMVGRNEQVICDKDSTINLIWKSFDFSDISAFHLISPKSRFWPWP